LFYFYIILRIFIILRMIFLPLKKILTLFSTLKKNILTINNLKDTLTIE